MRTDAPDGLRRQADAQAADLRFRQAVVRCMDGAGARIGQAENLPFAGGRLGAGEGIRIERPDAAEPYKAAHMLHSGWRLRTSPAGRSAPQRIEVMAHTAHASALLCHGWLP